MLMQLTAKLLYGGPLLRLLPGLCQLLIGRLHCIQKKANTVLQ